MADDLVLRVVGHDVNLSRLSSELKTGAVARAGRPGLPAWSLPIPLSGGIYVTRVVPTRRQCLDDRLKSKRAVLGRFRVSRPADAARSKCSVTRSIGAPPRTRGLARHPPPEVPLIPLSLAITIALLLAFAIGFICGMLFGMSTSFRGRR
jgi:hypothetical protein